jgi:hypothetical protein
VGEPHGKFLHDRQKSGLVRGRGTEPPQLLLATLQLPWLQDQELLQGHDQEHN